MKKFINEENHWNQKANADVLLGPIQRVAHVETINAIKKMKLEKATGFSELNTEINDCSKW